MDDSPTSGGLWGGRFAKRPARALDRINRSLGFDWHLWPYELRVDHVWLAELARIEALPADTADRLRAGLDKIARRLEEGSPESEPDEDIHSLIERWLEEEIGSEASLLRLGRSRNDVVATDTRLWAMDAAVRIDEACEGLQSAIVETATRMVDDVIPAYSHLQQAQPTRAAHWLLSHFWPLERNRGRLDDATARMNQLPLGAAAGMGTSLPVDRNRLATALGFSGACENSLDAVGARDWVSELLFAWTQTAIDLTRLAEDLIVYSSTEFALIRIADDYSTGSSLMPQKRNPDGAELARANGGILLGMLAGYLATLKGLPTGYNKDLQEDKLALLHAERRLDEVLRVLAGTVATLEIGPGAGGGDPAVLATDLADHLVEGGLSFKEAHALTGTLVRRAEELGVSVSDVNSTERARLDPRLEQLPDDVWDPERALERRSALGGSSRERVLEQLEAARKRLEADGAP
ncbi:MAG: argininosuccinate lyase [Gemmatimonadota bacterium]